MAEAADRLAGAIFYRRHEQWAEKEQEKEQEKEAAAPWAALARAIRSSYSQAR